MTVDTTERRLRQHLRNTTDGEGEDDLDALIAAAEQRGREEALAKHRCKPCGCGWCCANTPTDQRGEVHQRTCIPREGR